MSRMTTPFENGRTEFARLARVLTAARHAQKPLDAGDAGALVAECLAATGPVFVKRREEGIRDATYGVVSSYIELKLDSAGAVVSITRALPGLAPEIDPCEAMTWSLEGAAAAVSAGGREHRDKCFEALDAALYGAADVFMRACERAPRPA